MALLQDVARRRVSDVEGEVPPHRTYIMVHVAHRCADEWLQVANDLEQRASRTA